MGRTLPTPGRGTPISVIEVHGATKTYRRRGKPALRALDNVELVVEAGGVHGFLGPNGSGKTTTIRALLGLVRVDSGELRLLGHDVPTELPHAIASVGALVETPLFFPGFTGRLNLRLLADIAGVSPARVEECLEIVDLRERADERFKGYSLGMKQRLGIAAALLKTPRLLILDEPSNGLDPAGIKDTRDLIRRLGADGRTTVFLSSHLLAEVEQVCDHVSIMAKGRCVASGPVREVLTRRATGEVTLARAEPPGRPPCARGRGAPHHRPAHRRVADRGAEHRPGRPQPPARLARPLPVRTDPCRRGPRGRVPRADRRKPVSTLDVRPEPIAAVPSGRRPSLLRAEARRFISRRFIRVVLIVTGVLYVAGVIFASTQYSKPGPGVLADAEARRAAIVADNAQWHVQCAAGRPKGMTVEQACGSVPTAEDFGGIDNFIDKPPFSMASDGPDGVLFLGFAGAAIAFLLGATFIGAEWSTRSLVAQLFWAPQRLRVMGAKLAVLTGAAAALGVALQLAGLIENKWLAATRGTSDVPDGFWGDYLAVAGRGIVITILAALVGFGLANAMRHTAAALGVGFVYFAILESLVRAFRPAWQQWLFTDNVIAFVMKEPYTITLEGQHRDETGRLVVGSYEHVITHAHAGMVLAVITAAVVGIGVVLFARRDLN